MGCFIHWCKNGCGKKVLWRGIKEGYICKKCNAKHSKEEIKGVKNED
jgi:hypothetical protein